jgi:hypothetical protein
MLMSIISAEFVFTSKNDSDLRFFENYANHAVEFMTLNKLRLDKICSKLLKNNLQHLSRLLIYLQSSRKKDILLGMYRDQMIKGCKIKKSLLIILPVL